MAKDEQGRSTDMKGVACDVGKEERVKSVEAIMSVQEYGATNAVNRTLLAGFASYCRTHQLPPRLTAKQWKEALTTWRSAPVPA